MQSDSELLSPLQHFTDHWRAIYQSDDPRDALAAFEGSLPEELLRHMDRRLFPEPFYGLWDGDLSQDGVLLLINPGAGPASDGEAQGWNAGIRHRFATWGQAEYLAYDADPRQRAENLGMRWRLLRQRQAERATGLTTRFMHIIESCPYHSPRWASLSHEAREQIARLPSTRLALAAILDIARHRRTRWVLGIGEPWRELLRWHGLEGETREIQRAGRKRFAHRFTCYRVAPDALPIIIYSSGAGGMNLPRDEEAVRVLRELMAKAR
jgi:hypothetical protein